MRDVILFQVIEHIRSFDRVPSHYSREKTRERQFLASNLSIAKLFRKFLENKDITVFNVNRRNRRVRREVNRNLPLSYSTFRRIFRTFKLSFRRPYTDTCGKCDSLLIIKNYSQDEQEIARAQALKTNHIEQAEKHYECFRFDLKVLPKEKNKAHVIPWRTPPVWK